MSSGIHHISLGKANAVVTLRSQAWHLVVLVLKRKSVPTI